LTRNFSFYLQVKSVFLLTKNYFIYFKLFFKTSDLLQNFTGDTFKNHNTKSVKKFENYLKTFATENFEIFSKKLTSF